MIRIGIGSWTFPWGVGFRMNPYTYAKMSPLDLIDFAKKRDIHLVQLYNNINLLSLDSSDLKLIKNTADNADIELAIGGDGIEKEYIQKMLAIAESLRSRTVRVVILPKSESGKKLHVRDVIKQVKSYVTDFEDAGISMLIENHDRYTSNEYLEMIEGVGSDSVGICFDTANSLGKLEHFRDSFLILKDHIRSCHYKEYSIQRVESKLGFVIQGCKPGEGENIAGEFFQLLSSIKSDLDVVLEQWVPFQGSVKESLKIEKEWADEGIRILKKLTSTN